MGQRRRNPQRFPRKTVLGAAVQQQGGGPGGGGKDARREPGFPHFVVKARLGLGHVPDMG